MFPSPTEHHLWLYQYFNIKWLSSHFIFHLEFWIWTSVRMAGQPDKREWLCRQLRRRGGKVWLRRVFGAVPSHLIHRCISVAARTLAGACWRSWADVWNWSWVFLSFLLHRHAVHPSRTLEAGLPQANPSLTSHWKGGCFFMRVGSCLQMCPYK